MNFLYNIWQKLSKKQDQPTIKESSLSFIQQLNRYAPLLLLQEQRQLIEVVAGKTGLSYQSIILGVDIHRGQLQLDDLYPEHSLHPIEVGDWLLLKHQAKGKVMDFKTQILDINTQDPLPIITVELPQQVAYRERRSAQRLPLQDYQPLAVKLQLPWQASWFSTAHNISSGGLRVSVAGNHTASLNVNDRIPALEFTFNQDFQVRCQGKIKAFQFKRHPHRHTLISIEFIGLAEYQQAQLADFISQLSQPSLAA